jgi:hypothetical protein
MKSIRQGYKPQSLWTMNSMLNFKFMIPSFRYTSADFKEADSRKKSETKKEKSQGLDTCEYDEKEFERTIDDPTDKTKPYDNMFTKVGRPDLREQYEKRKDIFHTKDTPYMKKEKESKENQAEDKTENKKD